MGAMEQDRWVMSGRFGCNVGEGECAIWEQI